MMTMTRKEYQKPFMVVERFVANECVAACWYVKQEDILTVYYIDNKTTWFPIVHNVYGFVNVGERQTSSTIERIPTTGSNPKNIHDPLPQTINGGQGNEYYSDYGSLLEGLAYRDEDKLEKVYKYTYNGTEYVFTDYKDLGGNHS